MLCRLVTLQLPRLLPALAQTSRLFAQVPIERKLKRVLEKELEHEKKDYKPDDTVGPFLQNKGFQLEEQDSIIDLTLRKTVDDREVVVTFQARSPDGLMEDEEMQQSQEDPANSASYAEFQVAVDKGGQGLLFECMASNSEIRVKNVVASEDLKTTVKTSSFVETQKEYRGPEFEGLDEELQRAFLEYLKSLGVDEDLATFVESYSLDKEQRLYMDWLHKVKEFVS